jgi:hypothetical protein
MNHIALHLSEEFIAEDLDYYFSTERDKNNQVRPNEKIYSMTPTSTHLSQTLDDGQVGNFFFPCLPNMLDRIYIGTSIPLFANNWGASFLLQLLKILKPGGAIILPVYPEIQAQEKGYWSRSFLENAFLSRKRWTGFSNVIAENDGVMSLQVGRKWPAPIPSTIEWFYQQRSNLALQGLLESGYDTGNTIERIYPNLVENVWKNYTYSAVVEKIISDNFDPKTPVSFHNISNDYGLLLTELLLSTRINIINGVTTDVCNTAKNIRHNFKNYFSPHTGEHHKIESSLIEDISFHQQSNIISMFNVLSALDEPAREAILRLAWENLKPGGLLIVHGDLKNYLYDILGEFGELQAYSSIVASKIQRNVNISHYSSIQESKLIEEKHDQENVFLAVKKSSSRDKS